MDVTDDYTAQNLSARQRAVMKLIVRGLSNKEIASILNLAEGLTAKECLQSAEGCLALAHKREAIFGKIRESVLLSRHHRRT
jgi:ATP/maltotriose-dependent transcriptional regulator MalT